MLRGTPRHISAGDRVSAADYDTTTELPPRGRKHGDLSEPFPGPERVKITRAANTYI